MSTLQICWILHPQICRYFTPFPILFLNEIGPYDRAFLQSYMKITNIFSWLTDTRRCKNWSICWESERDWSERCARCCTATYPSKILHSDGLELLCAVVWGIWWIVSFAFVSNIRELRIGRLLQLTWIERVADPTAFSHAVLKAR